MFDPTTLDRQSADSANAQKAIDSIARGGIVAVVDDEDRENEGDLIMAAALATPEKIAFILRNTCGILCAPMTSERARDLDLELMVKSNDTPFETAFTVSVDGKADVTTGISAKDRCKTLNMLADPQKAASAFVRPGHVFPLIARDGGVLIRSGHTEAAVDLCRMANLPPVGAICELVNDNGTVMKGAQILQFCKDNAIALTSVAELIALRRRRETLVEKVSESEIDTIVGKARLFAFRSLIDGVRHDVLLFGNPNDPEPTPVRFHRSEGLREIVSPQPTLLACLKIFSQRKKGLLVYLNAEGVGVSPPLPAESDPTDDNRNWLDIGLGAQILRALGIKQVDLISSHAFHYVGLDGFGIKIHETINLEPIG